MTVSLLFAVGCSKSNEQPTAYPVEGRLTYKKQPMGGAVVAFHPVGNVRGAKASATADADGRYRLTTFATGDGALAGEYAVTVFWPGKSGSGSDPNLTPGADDPTTDRLDRAFATPEGTRLRATVREQPNTIDFNLP